jgi:hypothetical protein
MPGEGGITSGAGDARGMKTHAGGWGRCGLRGRDTRRWASRRVRGGVPGAGGIPGGEARRARA